MAFGAIEMYTNLFLQRLPRDQIAKSASKMVLNARFDLLIELLTNREDPLARMVLPLVAEAKGLARIRNTVAHEPLMLDIYVEPGKDDIRVETRMSSSKGPKEIAFNDLVTWREQAEQVAIKLTAAYYGSHAEKT